MRLCYFLLLVALVGLCGRFRLERILSPLSAGISLIVFTYGIIQKFVLFPWILGHAGTGPSFYEQALHDRVAAGRVFAIFPLPTLYAMVCGLLLVFVVHYFYRARGWARTFWFILMLLGGFNLFLTQSFGGILFFAMGILFYLFLARIFKIKYLAPLLMILALGFFMVTALRFSEARQLAPVKLRFINWLQAGRVIAATPLLGVGLGNYETAVPEHVYPGEPASIYAHNFFLQFAAESGIPLFLFLLAISFPLLKINLENLLRPENALFASAFILILFFNLFDVGNYFFAAGISFAVVFSQISRRHGRARPRHFAIVFLLAGVLLVNEVSAGQQQTGDLALSQQDHSRAEVHYRRSLHFNPYAYRSWLGLAHIAMQRQDLARTEVAANRIVRIYPQQPYANYLLSQVAWRRGAYLSSLAHAGQAAAFDKKNKEYQRWHETVQNNLAQQLPLPGN